MILARAKSGGGYTEIDIAASGEKDDIAIEAAAITVLALRQVGVANAELGALYAHMISDEVIAQFKNEGTEVEE